MDFDYKKYSLEQLDNWMHDALSSAEASPQEIYDVIKGVVEEQYVYFKEQANRCSELLGLLSGDRKHRIPVYDEFRGSTVSSVMPPWGHSDMEALRYTEEELNAMCDKAASDQEKEQCREYNLREAEYYDKRAKLDMSYQEAIAAGWTMTDDGFWIKEDKVKKWVLPVEEAKDVDTDKTDYFVSFPDDLLEAANLKEGDQVEWVDNGDGSYTLTKVTKPLGMEEC
jgi:hypothetical protein